MKFIGICIDRLPSGMYKAYFWGEHDDHISSWRGCNYRKISVYHQPKNGFLSLSLCEEFIRRLYPQEKQAEYGCPGAGFNGCHMKEDEHVKRTFFDW